LNLKPTAFGSAPQGVGIDGQCAGWNSGYLGKGVRRVDLEETDSFFEALDEYEQCLLREYQEDIKRA
jgi:hypothetical protein